MLFLLFSLIVWKNAGSDCDFEGFSDFLLDCGYETDTQLKGPCTHISTPHFPAMAVYIFCPSFLSSTHQRRSLQRQLQTTSVLFSLTAMSSSSLELHFTVENSMPSGVIYYSITNLGIELTANEVVTGSSESICSGTRDQIEGVTSETISCPLIDGSKYLLHLFLHTDGASAPATNSDAFVERTEFTVSYSDNLSIQVEAEDAVCSGFYVTYEIINPFPLGEIIIVITKQSDVATLGAANITATCRIVISQSSGVQRRFIECDMEPDTVYLLNIAWSSNAVQQELGILLSDTISCSMPTSSPAVGGSPFDNSEDCEDTNEICAQIQTLQQLQSNICDSLSSLCPRACGLCIPSPSQIPSIAPVDTPTFSPQDGCIDTLEPASDCEFIAELGLCSEVDSCRFTCNQCGSDCFDEDSAEACDAIVRSNLCAFTTSCKSSCGMCFDCTGRLEDCLEEYSASCVSVGSIETNDALNCLMELPDDNDVFISACCDEYIDDLVPEECNSIYVSGGPYDGWYSVEDNLRNTRYHWTMGNNQIYWTSDTLGSRWVLHGDDGGYFSIGSVAYKPPTEKEWNGYESGLIASGGTLTLLTFDCSRDDAPPTAVMTPKPSKAPTLESEATPCTLEVSGSTHYDGIYVPLASLRNGETVWQRLGGVGTVELYYSSGPSDPFNTWVLSGPAGFVTEMGGESPPCESYWKYIEGDTTSCGDCTSCSDQCISVIDIECVDTELSSGIDYTSDVENVPTMTCPNLYVEGIDFGGAYTIVDNRMKNGYHYWTQVNGQGELYWSTGLFGDRWVLAGGPSPQGDATGFLTPEPEICPDIEGTMTWNYYDYQSASFLVPVPTEVTITCGVGECTDEYSSDFCSLAQQKCQLTCGQCSLEEEVVEECLDIIIQPDNYPDDISWQLISESGSAWGGGWQGSTSCIDVGYGCHTFRLLDNYGDGICCGQGFGYVKWLWQGVERWYWSEDVDYSSKEWVICIYPPGGADAISTTSKSPSMDPTNGDMVFTSTALIPGNQEPTPHPTPEPTYPGETTPHPTWDQSTICHQIHFNWTVCDDYDFTQPLPDIYIDPIWEWDDWTQFGQGRWFGQNKDVTSQMWVSLIRGSQWTALSGNTAFISKHGDGTIPTSGEWCLYRDCYDLTETCICTDVTITCLTLPPTQAPSKTPSSEPTKGPTVTPDYPVTINIIDMGTGTFELVDESADPDSLCPTFSITNEGAETTFMGAVVCTPMVPEDTPKDFKITEVPPGQICRIFGPNPESYGPDVPCLDDGSESVECDVYSLSGSVSLTQTGPTTLWVACYDICPVLYIGCDGMESTPYDGFYHADGTIQDDRRIWINNRGDTKIIYSEHFDHRWTIQGDDGLIFTDILPTDYIPPDGETWTLASDLSITYPNVCVTCYDTANPTLTPSVTDPSHMPSITPSKTPSVQPTKGPTVTREFGVIINIINLGTGTFALSDESDDSGSLCSNIAVTNTGEEMDFMNELVCPLIVPEDTQKEFKITEVPFGQICRIFGPNPESYGPDFPCLDDAGQPISCEVDSLVGEVSVIQTGHVTLWAACYESCPIVFIGCENGQSSPYDGFYHVDGTMQDDRRVWINNRGDTKIIYSEYFGNRWTMQGAKGLIFTDILPTDYIPPDGETWTLASDFTVTYSNVCVTCYDTAVPTRTPTVSDPTDVPSIAPTASDPSLAPSIAPTASDPSRTPSMSPSAEEPSITPSAAPTLSAPSTQPTVSPSAEEPTKTPSIGPTADEPSRTLR